MFLSKRNKRIALITLGLIVLSCAVLVLWAFVIEPNRLVVKEETIVIKDWPPSFDHLRIVLISDLHVGSPHITVEKLRQVVMIINQQQADLILIAGDFVIQDVLGGEFVGPEAIAAELKGLRARDGVFAVLGNHDWYYDGEHVTRALNNAGIRVLENDVAQIKRDGQSIWIAGLADLWTRPQQITTTLGKIPGQATIIALTHNPDIFPKIPSSVPLTLAGHTHGGQVNLPLIGRSIVPSEFDQRYAIGHIEENGHHLFVTPGIGTSILPVRFRVPPEISVITITSGSAAQ
jgi:predicted MPP superfamily phosphohydrolase